LLAANCDCAGERTRREGALIIVRAGKEHIVLCWLVFSDKCS